ncbi:hypothetical protein CHRY9293_01638 [Chryseobacterium potabilaquae]|uniref:Uncharacterized protein n=1 Tax=Chryseobacterium potabilaquae TaxID=2675057 RepID=A0A6N4X4K5_9FLAO|nr:hypothetical protein CHRY9293_01638 [Chryseobacterium potabilaquae]
MIIDIKVEYVPRANIRMGTESEIIRIGLIDGKGQMEKTEIEYKTAKGKVKIV